MLLERVLDHAALDTLAASVNEPDLSESRCVSSTQILLNDVRDIARRERVEVEGVFDRDFVHQREF